ncbi:MAG: DUF5510 family protein [Rickettsia endosymbiont of Argas persicus]
MLKILLHIITLLCINFKAYATSMSTYTTSDIAKIAILLGIVVLIFSPARFRIAVIGTILGLAFAYFVYKYIIPIFIGSLSAA